MTKFVEKLKKHRYIVTKSVNDSRAFPTTWTLRLPEDRCVIIWDRDDEQPDLAFWCLEEIERLGYEFILAPWDTQNSKYQCVIDPGFRDTDHDPVFGNGKTKTEACCNALLVVLEHIELKQKNSPRH